MIVARVLLLIAACLRAQNPFDEEPRLSQPIREKHWRQMEAFADAIAEGPEALRRVLKNRIGYPVEGLRAAGPLRLEKTGEDAAATYHRAFLPMSGGLEAYGLYIVPKTAGKKPAPLVISQHGGGGFPEMAAYNGGANYKDQVRGAVAEGYVVYAPLVLMYPFGDRDRGTAIPAEVRKEMDAKLRKAGYSLAALELSKLRLLLDELVLRPEIDRHRIAMIGLSYGGFYATYAAALEPRIQVVVASCSFRDDPAIADGQTEGRLLDLAPGEMAALVAPRPMQVQSGIADKLIPIEQSRAGAKRAREYYKKAGAEEKFLFVEFDGGHEFRGSLAWPFLKKWL